MSNEICEGRGVVLQSSNAAVTRYTSKMEADYRQRCFRVQHYDDVVINMKQGIDSGAVLQKINAMDALIVWIVDLFDFESNLLSSINHHLLGEGILTAATKRDLLPTALGNEKLSQLLLRRLKGEGILVQGTMACGDLVIHARREDNASADEMCTTIIHCRRGRDIVVMGMANARRNTLLNAIRDGVDLTTSWHPDITLDLSSITVEGYQFYGTLELTRMDSLLTHMDDGLLKAVIPLKLLKTRGYQLEDNRTLSLGGFVRLDLIRCEQVSYVTHFSEKLPLHRNKQEKTNVLWAQHHDETLIPVIGGREHMKEFSHGYMQEHRLDVVVRDLGWFCIRGDAASMDVYVAQQGNIMLREAMIQY